MNWLLAPYRDPQTFRTVAYLLTGLFMGVFSFVVVVTGLALGIGLLVTVIGVPILVATLAIAHSLATVERGLARTLLDVRLPERSRYLSGDVGYLARLRYQVTSRRTWAEIAFLLLRLPMGILDFTIVVSVLGLAFGGFVSPWLVVFGVEGSIGDLVIDTLPESFLYVPVSALFLITGGRIVTAWGAVSRALAMRLLWWVDSEDVRREVADVVARREGVDAFEILADVKLRLGAEGVVDATRVQAALLSLQQTGHVAGSTDGARIVYRAA